MLSLIKGLMGWKTYAIVGAVCFTAGGWTVHKFHKAGERATIEKILLMERKANERALVGERTIHAKQLEIAKAQVKVKEVIRYVKDNRSCDIPPATARLLEAHRQGLQSTEPDVGDTRVTTKITQTREVEGHFDIADRFISCRTQIIELKKYYE